MKAWLMLAIAVLAVAFVFIFINDDAVGLAPRAYKAALPDLTTNIFVGNVVNISTNGSVQFLINYTIIYKNIGNVIATNISASSGSSMQCIGGGGGGGGGGFQIPSLSPNQAITYSSYSTPTCHGTWSAFAMIDQANNITELNENNNNASVSVII